MIEFGIHRQPEKETTVKNLISWISKYWFQLAICFFLFQFYQSRNVQIVVGQGSEASLSAVEPVKAHFREEKSHAEMSISPALPDGTISEGRPAPAPSKWKSSDFRNLSFVLDPGLARRKGVDESIVQEKLTHCREYVERFATTAIQESQQFGMPASIKLAQGLLETDAGSSKLATESNNHFGIKCRSKCRGCTCRNYSDDEVYDMFRVFDTAWESYREHSRLLQIERYSKLKKLGTKDYEGWARGLKKAGYATDKNYDSKLIRIIESLDLHQFDK